MLNSAFGCGTSAYACSYSAIASRKRLSACAASPFLKCSPASLRLGCASATPLANATIARLRRRCIDRALVARRSRGSNDRLQRAGPVEDEEQRTDQEHRGSEQHRRPALVHR